ncbi:MAG: Crp/Fnr family transcriptional regulator [Pseudomonadota bacterium]|jgi:CRP/FNR family cyclic AMP-dependent transcriptional regulator|uniref:Crp/Fnr family transcriptional regulator n=2 Tax=Burkholderiaceae TaxID=119060 RepID=UPI0010F8FACD|nr:Crp/Fnr family transcriptional regulator [Burkholderia sp. 4M9327F10]
MGLSASVVETISGSPWFSSLPPAEQSNLAANSTLVRINVDESLFRRGDPADGFYGIVDGRLKASNVRSDGKEAILSILEPGNWFGEMSAITGWPYAHDVIALETAQVLKLPLEAFHACMQSAAFAKLIAELLAQHTGLLYQMLEDATLHSTRARIARRLVRLAHGDATLAAGNRSDIQVSQDTLAMMLGISRQTLALELKEMASKGALALRYGKVEIVSMDVLKSFDD